MLGLLFPQFTTVLMFGPMTPIGSSVLDYLLLETDWIVKGYERTLEGFDELASFINNSGYTDEQRMRCGVGRCDTMSLYDLQQSSHMEGWDNCAITATVLFFPEKFPGGEFLLTSLEKFAKIPKISNSPVFVVCPNNTPKFLVGGLPDLVYIRHSKHADPDQVAEAVLTDLGIKLGDT